MDEDGTTRDVDEVKRSVRLVFEYQGEAITLVSQRKVAMVAPAPQRLTSRPNERGFWVELKDAQDRSLYRHVQNDPIQRHLEVPADDGQHLSRVPIDEPAGRFSIIVPHLRDTRTVSLVEATERHQGERGSAVAELARFDLELDPRAGD